MTWNRQIIKTSARNRRLTSDLVQKIQRNSVKVHSTMKFRRTRTHPSLEPRPKFHLLALPEAMQAFLPSVRAAAERVTPPRLARRLAATTPQSLALSACPTWRRPVRNLRLSSCPSRVQRLFFELLRAPSRLLLISQLPRRLSRSRL